MRAAWKLKVGLVTEHAVCFLSSIMGHSTLSARTMQTRDPGALQHLTMTLMECGDTVVVRTFNRHNAKNVLRWSTILSTPPEWRNYFC